MPQRDPYDGFRNEDQRRRALGTRDRWRYCAQMVAAVAFAAVGAWPALPALFRKLLDWVS